MTKTIETLPQTSGALLCLRLHGTVSAEDFIAAFDAPLKAVVEKYGHYSLYLHYAPDFVRWSPEAADLSFKCISAFSPKVRRCAYINPPPERLLMMKFLDPLMAADVRYFNENEQDDAMMWIQDNNQ